MVTFLFSLITALVLTGLSIPLLRGAQFMDIPNHRSSHVQPVPRGGGVAVIVTLAIAVLAFAQWSTALAVVLSSMLAIAAVGLADDLWNLRSGPRLVLQVAAGAALACWAVTSGVSIWWVPAIVVAVAGYINAFNFMDGVNGISGLTAAMVGAWWWGVGGSIDHDLLSTVGAALLGAAVGFLPWNAPSAKVFLGDVGSYGIGLLVVALSIVAWVDGVTWLMTLAPLAVYGADTGWVLLKRARGGRPLTEAHREHVYQRLTDHGWPHLASAGFCAAAGAAVCASSLLAEGGQRLAALCLVLLCIVLYLCAPIVVARRMVTP